MIKNILFPEKIKGYYLFPQRILGIDVGSKEIIATQSYMYGRTQSLESIYTQKLDLTLPSYNDQVETALISLMEHVSHIDQVWTSFPSSYVTFREITLPFVQRDKIALVLNYETEKLLPFSSEQAIIDFVITKQTETSSTVMIAATQKQYIAQHIELFARAGISPQKIIVDIFAYYGLFKEIPAYQQSDESFIFIDLGFTGIRIAYIDKGRLTAIRTLQQGLKKIVGKPALEEKLLQSGFEKTNQNGIDALVTELQFTIEILAPSSQKNTTKESSKKEGSPSIKTQPTKKRILLTGSGAAIPDAASYLQKKLGIPTELFSINEMIENKTILLHHDTKEGPQSLLSICTSIPTSTTEECNLRQKEFMLSDSIPFAKQMITALALFVITIITIVSVGHVQKKQMKLSIRTAERSLRSSVQDTLNLDEQNITRLIGDAQKAVTNQTKIWFAFSRSTRSSFLAQLQKLSTNIDTAGIGLKLNRLSLNNETIRLQGEVKNIPALITLEKELKKVNLGSFVRPQEPAFDITIVLKKDMEDLR